MSEIAKNRKHSDETKRKLSKLAKERKTSYWKGKKLPLETRRKLSNAKKGKYTVGKKVLIVKNNKIIDVTKSRAECYRRYTNNEIKEYDIRKKLDFFRTSKSFDFNKMKNDETFYIYEEDYSRLKPQSTIEKAN